MCVRVCVCVGGGGMWRELRGEEVEGRVRGAVRTPLSGSGTVHSFIIAGQFT